MSNSSSLFRAFEEDPGSDLGLLYIKELLSKGETREALPCLLKSVNANPSGHIARLLLARFFFTQGLTSLAAREVKELAERIPDNEALERLSQKLSPRSVSASSKSDGSNSDAVYSPDSNARESIDSEAEVAEADFDFSDIELLDKKQ